MKNSLGLKQLLSISFFLVFQLSQAQLAKGDLAIIGFNSDASPDQMTLVALATLQSGEVIYISDNAWNGSSFNTKTSNGVLTWTLSSNVPAGTILSLTISSSGVTSTDMATYGTVVKSSGWTASSSAVASGGDCWHIYQGTGPYTFIFSWSNSSAGTMSSGWMISGTPATTSSYIGSGLANGVDAIILNGSNHKDNLVYTGQTSPDKATILADIVNTSNWNGSETVVQNISAGIAFPSQFTLGSACSMTASITSQTDVSCNGNSDGILTVTASNGAANYDYSWDGAANTTGSSNAINSVSGLSAGTYTVTVTDNNSCTATANATIAEPAVLLGGSITAN